jgi:hypothetical protein
VGNTDERQLVTEAHDSKIHHLALGAPIWLQSELLQLARLYPLEAVHMSGKRRQAAFGLNSWHACPG